MSGQKTTRVVLVVLSNQLSPEKLTEHLGIGSRTWHRGDPKRPGSKYMQPYNGWELASSLDDSTPIRQQVKELVTRMRPIGDLIGEWEREGLIQPARVWIHASNPDHGISIDPADLVAIGAVASLEIDIY